MHVIKVLNNSLVLALDDNGQETILMGKGIGFNKSIGKEICAEEIEKVFVLKDRMVSRNIIRLAAETDSIFFELAKNVIDYAIDMYQMVLMEHIYMSLTDHISFAAQRFSNGVILHNFYTQDIKRFNEAEFDVGAYAVCLINKQLHIDLPLDEAGNIAFHFINAQPQRQYDNKEQLIHEMVNDVMSIVRYSYGNEYDQDSLAYAKFVTHLRLFSKRLLEHDLMPEDAEDTLYKQLMETCAREAACVRRIEVYVKKKFGLKLTNQEKLYLMIHIHRINGSDNAIKEES